MGKHRNRNNLNKQIIKSELVDKTGKDKLDLNDDSLVEAEEADTNVETEEADTNVETKPKTTKPKTAKDLVERHIDKSVQAKQIELDRRLTEAEIIELENKFARKVKQIDNTISSFKNDADRKQFYDQALESFGIPEDEQKKLYALDPNKWTASDIIQSLGIYVIRQEVKNTSANYDKQIPDWVRVEQVENGAVEYMYHDYFDADENPAYKDVELSDYNQGVNATTYEVYRATKNIHKGYDILDVRLNDIARNSSIFLAIMGDLQFNIARPIAKVIFRYKLQLIANPFTDLEMGGIDVSDVPADITINATDYLDFITQLNILSGAGGELYYTSRNRDEREEWKPDGFENGQEITLDLDSTEIMIPVEIYRDVVGNKDILGAYQLDKLELPTWRPFSYDKTFKEYGLVTGINNSKENFDMFIKSGNALNLIVHYNLTKDIDTPVGKRVVNTYTRLGSAIDKRFRVYKVNVRIGGNQSEQLSTVITESALGEIADNDAATIKAAVIAKNSNATDGYTITDITDTTANAKGDGRKYTGTVKLEFTITA
jgi:hypothetical protein